ncbi:RABGGTA [Bugula neritina]|uniref:Geranylgeranyl transferase type-2 subunit alpha n=1 Tax=Bugula neritina TaxID=10212 RepID=A0A7J7JL80_BUGNE|nr:RABGGTA [Bugula neritina]
MSQQTKHGRLKVKTTEEQEEAKRIERLKKQKLYQAATDKIFAKRAAGEYDVEALKLTSGVLSKNPDVYTLWNYRKEIFNFLQKSVSSDELLAMFSDELTFLEECLKYNPKSYGSWEHRCYVMTHTPKPDWERELSLCNAFLSYDERNFHCWDYRRFIIKQSNVKPEDELKFTFEKIASNFSNYSSWHYRSKLLPQLFSAETNHSSGLQQSTLLEEMELVQNAFFTDPNDQSAWFYHRWLLGRVENSLELLNIDELLDKSLMVLTFSMPVKVIETTSSSSVDLPFNWFSPSNERFSPVWCSVTGDRCTSVKVKHKLQEYQFTLTDVVDAQARSMKLYFRFATFNYFTYKASL